MSEEKSQDRDLSTKTDESLATSEPQAATTLDPSPGSSAPGFIERLVVDLQDGIDEVWQALQPRTAELLRKGKHTQVRLSYKGREFARLSLLAFLAAEAVAILRISLPAVLMFNVAGKMFLTVDFVDEVAELGEKGEKHLGSGDIDSALSCFDAAIELDPYRTAIYLQRGKALSQKGDGAGAREAFEKALELDPEGEAGAKARELLVSLEA